MRKRNFVYTFNNYTIEDEQRLQSIDCRYHTYGREIAPTTGTRHLQGYICFVNPRSLTAIRTLLGCHVEAARGNHQQAKDYSQKEDPDFFEEGEIPEDPADRGAAEKRRWQEAFDAAKMGQLEEIPPDILLRHYSTIKRIGQDFSQAPQRLEQTTGTWIHGDSGCGKTRAVFDFDANIYLKGLNKWWDGYIPGKNVLIDDLDPTHASWIGHFLKRWCDLYPFPGETKGGNRVFRPPRIFITSQYTIDQVFPDLETRDALTRRCRIINKLINIPIQL